MGEKRNIVAVFDLDHTITRIDTYPAFLLSALRKRPSRWLPALTVPVAVLLQRVGFFDNTWLKKFAFRMVLSGLHRKTVDELTQAFVDTIVKKNLRPSALRVIEHHKTSGHEVVLATASLDIYVTPLAARIGFESVVCTKVDWKHDRLSSQDSLTNCYGPQKLDCVQELIGKQNNAIVVAYSDSEADLPLLKQAQVPVAVNPTRKLLKLATEYGYTVQNWQRSQLTHQNYEEIKAALSSHST